MRFLRLVHASSNPLAQELDLLQRLQAAAACDTERLRLTIEGRRLMLDGFVGSVDEKFQLEVACRELAPGSLLVNRLRVAAFEQRRVS